MRPLKLELEGFTAFKDQTILDLSQLDLFAITGPTGAGKSSLIDAIAYALYGRVPRVSNEVSSCISQGLDRMLVGLEFMAGEERYRIFRETKRKGAPNVRLDRWREDGWQPLHDRARDVNESVAEIVGLDYDGFTRSVLLPQGQFQEFLAGSTEKRRAVLSSLLRLQVYESMRKRASAMASDMKTRIEEREHQLAGMAEATPENVRRLQAELKSAGVELDAMQARLKSLEAGAALAATLKQAQDRFDVCRTEAAQALSDFEDTKRRLDEGEQALAQTRAEVERLTAELEANAYDAGRHNALSIALERVKALAQSNEALQRARAQYQGTEAEATRAREAMLHHREAAEAAQQARIEAEETAAVAQREESVAQAEDTERQQALGIARERLQALERAQANVAQLQMAHDDATVQSQRASAAVEAREHTLEAARADCSAAEAGWAEAQRHDLAATLQQGLEPGDACPVCGGVIGELSPFDASGLQAAEKQLMAARKAEADALASLTTASSVAARASATAEGLEAQLVTLTASLQAVEQSLAEALPTDVEAAAGQIDAALRALQAAQVARRERLQAVEAGLAAARRLESQANAALGTASEALTRAEAALENGESQIAALETRIDDLAASVAEVLPPDLEATPVAVETALREQVQARSERMQLDNALKDANTRAQAMQKQREDAQRHLMTLEARSITAVDALEAADKALSEAAQALEEAAVEWPDVIAAVRGQGNAVALLRGRIEEAQTRQAALVRTAGQLETRIEYLKAEVERAEALRNSLSELKQEHNVAADLTQMLGAARFQTFIQQEALSILAAQGSQRLEQLSAGRYKLKLDERGAEFEVVDQWNADLARSVKTLSGGETFLASLALSLALAESLPGLAASRRVVLDSIFLDEGFGSLDAEALDRAADALDALRADNRMVCIVTHLPELAQRLPARVVVTKTEAGSSVAIA